MSQEGGPLTKIGEQSDISRPDKNQGVNFDKQLDNIYLMALIYMNPGSTLCPPNIYESGIGLMVLLDVRT